jgi:ribulose-phosphate 3-epimerase
MKVKKIMDSIKSSQNKRDHDIYAKVAPSIFACDFTDLLNSIQKVEKSGCRYLHLDIMDGHFVPNISFGPKISAEILDKTVLLGDVHLMIENPLFFLDMFNHKNVQFITVHFESFIEEEKKLIEIIDKIHSLGKKAGVSIKPATDVKILIPYLELFDLVLVMTVEPGFSGQKMIESALDKIDKLSNKRASKGYSFLIEVDGGVNFENASSLIERGADLLVMGSAFFK